MKLRVKGNSIRIRLTRTELDQFTASGRVEDCIDFGPQGKLIYGLRLDPAAERMAVQFCDQAITIGLPASLAQRWTTTELVSLRGAQEASGGELTLLVEKDFKCLAEREDEDESDMFAHPLADG